MLWLMIFNGVKNCNCHMIRLKKIKSKIHFSGVIVISLCFFTIAIAIAALITLRTLSDDSVSKLESTLSNYSSGLFLEDTQRKALSYSNVFNKAASLTKVISYQTALGIKSSSKYSFESEQIKQYCDNFKKNDASNILVNESNNGTMTLLVTNENEIPLKLQSSVYTYSFMIPLLEEVCVSNSNSILSSWVWFNKDNLFSIYSENNDFLNTFLKKGCLNNFITNLKPVFEDKDIEGVYFTNVYTNASNIPVITASYKYYNKGKLVFTVGVDIKASCLKEKMIDGKVAILGYKERIRLHNIESFAFIFSSDGKSEQIIVSSIADEQYKLMENDNADKKKILYLPKKVLKNVAFKVKGKKGSDTFKFNGYKYLLTFCDTSVKNWFLIVAVREKNYLAAVKKAEDWINKSFAGFEANFILVFVFFLLLTTLTLIVFFRKHIIKPISKLRNDVFRMGQGNFDIVMRKHGVKEIASLADSFNNLGHRLEKYIKQLKEEVTERNKRDREMQVAKRIQQSVLPRISSAIKRSNIRLYVRLHPARNVAGDFYDFFFISENRLVCLIADVSGKGVSAAFYMTIAKRTIRNACINEPDEPGKALKLANDLLCEFNLKMFVSVFLIYYDLNSEEFKYANGGHNEPVILRKDGKDEFFGTQHDMVLGMMPDLEYHTGSKNINIDDMLVLYTDGITEANESNDDSFGEERLMEFLVKNKNLSAKNMCRSLIAFVHNFEKGTQYDDMTVFTFKRKS